MEEQTISPEDLRIQPPAEAGPQPETSPAEKRNVSDMFTFARFVHVGPGAQECEEGEDGSCSDPKHFHAWCRIPNQFQEEEIRIKAMAAKARKIRQLRDPESDSFAILDGEIRELALLGEKSVLVDELVNRNFWKDHSAAVHKVDAMDEFEHIGDDRERLRAIQETPEEERSEDELRELLKHLTAYREAIEEARKKEQAPMREALMAKTIEELAEDVREGRIQAEATQVFMRTYGMWEWYIGTLVPRPDGKTPVERVFKDINLLKAAAPEVIEELEMAFNELESALGERNASGN